VPSRDEREPDVHLTILDRLAGSPPVPAAPAPGRVTGAGARAVRALRLSARSATDSVRARIPGTDLRRASSAVTRAVPRAVRSVRDAIADATATMDRLVRRAVVPALYALAGIALAVAVSLGWLESSRARLRPVETGVVPPRAASAPPDRLVAASAALGDPAVTEDAKLAIVDDVASDPRDGAVDVLLSTGRGDSVLVALAGIRALRGRPCSRIAAPLAGRLGHDDWRQRAWAAKVLGENACAAARPELRGRLASERDGRVRRQLSIALDALAAG
jgi:hypothetical protein